MGSSASPVLITDPTARYAGTRITVMDGQDAAVGSCTATFRRTVELSGGACEAQLPAPLNSALQMYSLKQIHMHARSGP